MLFLFSKGVGVPRIRASFGKILARFIAWLLGTTLSLADRNRNIAILPAAS
jgi:hypothetical protein